MVGVGGVVRFPGRPPRPRSTLDSQMYDPWLARESTATMMPPLKMKPSVVVPWLGLTSVTASR